MQSSQYELPRSDEPVVHLVQLVAEPPLLMVPAGQRAQVPLELKMLPGGQGLQLSDPLISLLPATGSHGLHSVAPASSWYSPLEQDVQSVAPPAAILALVPGRHLVHTPALMVPEYSPTAHGVHELALAPVPKLPGLHSTQAPEESSL